MAAASALALARPPSASARLAFVFCISAEMSRRWSDRARACSTSAASFAFAERSNSRASSMRAARRASRSASLAASSSRCSWRRWSSPRRHSCRNCASSRSTSVLIFAASSCCPFHISTSLCKASLLLVLSPSASLAACSSPAFCPSPSSSARHCLARSAWACLWAWPWTSACLSNISRQSLRSRSLALCASSRCTSMCSRSASLPRTASAKASSDSRICWRRASEVVTSLSRSPSACAKRDSNCRVRRRAVCIEASSAAASFARPASRSCSAARSVPAAAASASRATPTASTRACRSDTSRSRLAISSSSSLASSWCLALQLSPSLLRTSLSARSFTWRLCSESRSLDSSSCSCFAVAPIFSISVRSSFFMLAPMDWAKFLTSAFSWPCIVLIAPDLADIALAQRKHSSSLVVSCFAVLPRSSSHRRCSSSRLRFASAAQRLLSRLKASSKCLRLSISLSLWVVRLLSSSVCRCTSSTSLLLVPLRVLSVLWSSSFASATRSMSALRSWHRFCASLRLCRNTS
mmetsp:Transcript_38306/g.110662  ORF Transcript_38306/g.110662 Transcript_38306/m.110662 type:complete len:524 (+) Transcript_38306:946-2517(+)